MLKQLKVLSLIGSLLLLAVPALCMPSPDAATNSTSSTTTPTTTPTNTPPAAAAAAAPTPTPATNTVSTTIATPPPVINNVTTLASLLSHNRTVPFGRLLINSTEFMNFALKEAENIVNKVLLDADVIAYNSEVMREERSGLSLFAQQAKNSRRLVAAIDAPLRSHFLLIGTKSMMVHKFVGIIKRHNTTQLMQSKIVPLEDHKLIEKALHQNGVLDYENKLKEKELLILKHLYSAVKAYIDTLTPEQKAKEQAMVNWYEKYKSVFDPLRKNEIYKEFSKLYERPHAVH